MDVVETVTVVNDTEVTVVLSRPSNAWLFDLGTPVGAMFDPSGVADLANTAVGTGPFTIESWKRGEAIKMAARDGYWGTAPKVKTVTLRYFADADGHHQCPALGRRGRRLQHAGTRAAANLSNRTRHSRSWTAPPTARWS